MTVWKKVLFSFTVTVFSLITLAGLLECGSRIYTHFRPFGDEIGSDSEAPLHFAEPPPRGERKYELRVDWSFRKKTGFKNPNNALWDKDDSTDLWRTEASGYSIYKPNTHIRAVERATGHDHRVLFDTFYTTDDHRRRLVPVTDGQGPFTKHVAFFGCSFVFGQGLPDDQTLPAQYQRLTNHDRVYNIGRMGGSVTDAIVMIKGFSTWDDFESRDGMAIMSFEANMHLARFLGTIRTVGVWNQHGAYLKLDPKTGRYVFGGIFDRDAGFRTAVSELLAESAFLRLIHFDWPATDGHAYEAYAKAIDDLRSYYWEKYGRQNPFIVYTQPSNKESEGIIGYLEQKKIPYLDYADFQMADYATEPLEIPYDGHPSKEYNRILSSQIYHDLSNPENAELLKRLAAERIALTSEHGVNEGRNH